MHEDYTFLSGNSLNLAYFGAELFTIRGKYHVPASTAHGGKTWIVSLTYEAMETQKAAIWSYFHLHPPLRHTPNISVVMAAFITTADKSPASQCSLTGRDVLL